MKFSAFSEKNAWLESAKYATKWAKLQNLSGIKIYF